MSAVVCKCVVETNYIHDRDGKIIGKQLTEPKRFLSVPECPKCGKPYFAPATLADKALAYRLVTKAERHADLERNRLINTAVTDLDRIINQHNPDVDTSINNGVWDCLDRLCAQLESRAMADDAAIADKHRSRVAGHHPDVERPDRVAQGYGNAALNIAAEIRAKIGGTK